jgi:hypothetical protein
VKQVRGVGKGGYYRHTTVGAKHCLIGVEGKVGEAQGFQILRMGHFASPIVREGRREVTGVTDGSMAFIFELPVSNESCHFVLRRKGGSYAQAEKPEIQEPGRPEGLPRTAAIAQ